jgi:hypothetical protein
VRQIRADFPSLRIINQTNVIPYRTGPIR